MIDRRRCPYCRHDSFNDPFHGFHNLYFCSNCIYAHRVAGKGQN
jgi:hypothetical protein